MEELYNTIKRTILLSQEMERISIIDFVQKILEVMKDHFLSVLKRVSFLSKFEQAKQEINKNFSKSIIEINT